MKCKQKLYKLTTQYNEEKKKMNTGWDNIKQQQKKGKTYSFAY